MERKPLVSFFIIARNAAETLPLLLEDLKMQDYPADKIEFLFADSGSSDETKAIFLAFATENTAHYHRILVLDNEKQTLPCGWNLCLSKAEGELILRVDAHSTIPVDFIRQNVLSYLSGHDISGGLRTSIPYQEGPWQETLLSAERSLFGSGLAAYRRATDESKTDTVAHGAYARYVFEKVGGYDERLTRTEDNEMHYRMRKAGFEIWRMPTITSCHRVRGSFSRMMKQKYANGYWIGLTLGVVPGCIHLFHLVPAAFVAGLVLSLVLTFFSFPWLLVLCLGGYTLVNLLMSVASLFQERPFLPHRLLLPFFFLLLHLSYGVGTWVGLFKMPFWRKKNPGCAAIEEVREALLKNHPASSEE